MTDTTIEPTFDVVCEWRLLNKLLLSEYRDYVNRLAPLLFTGIRQEVFRAITLTFIDTGTITYEGIHQYMQGNVPGELAASNAGDIDTLIKQTARLAKRRQLQRTREKLQALEKEYDPNAEDIRSTLDFEPIMAEEDSTLGIGVQSFLGNLHAKKTGDYIFAHTGFKFMDRNIGGEYKPKSLIILMGGVGAGKTTLWLNSQKAMAKGYTSKHTGELIQTPSLFISLEMSKEDLLMKMIADELSIDSGLLLAGEFESILVDSHFDTIEALCTAIENKSCELQQLPMFVIDNGRLGLAQILYEIRKHVHKHHVRVVGIDYLQLINHHPTGNDNHDLGEIAEALHQIAKRENITIIVLSQVNRQGDKENALRDSGEVQAVADVIMQIMPQDDDGMATVLRGVDIAFWKNRNGPAGRKVPILFNGVYQRFVEGS